MLRLGVTATSSITVAGLAATAARLGWLSPTAGAAICAVAALGLITVVVWGSADPSLRLFGPAITQAQTGRPEVALSFDDGPDPQSTPQILAALAEAEAHATFFLLVDRAEAHPALTRAIAESHEVGLHGLSHHPWLNFRGVEAGAAELNEARSRLEALIGRPVTAYRPPFGAVSPRLIGAIARTGLSLVWCSVRTRDGGKLSQDQVRRRCARAQAGDIVLLHEGRPTTTAAVPQILEDLATRGLRPVTTEALCRSV